MKSAELRNQRAALVAEARKIVDKAEAEKREMHDEERASVDAKMADVDNLAQEIAKAERSEKLETVEAELRVAQPRKTAPSIPSISHRQEITQEDRNYALRSWGLAGSKGADNSQDCAIRTANAGVNLNSNTLELRALSVGTTTAGGYTVPTTLSTAIEKALKYYSDVRQFCKVITTATGNELDWPTVTDVANQAAILAEAGGANTTTDPTFGKVVFKSEKFHSDIVKVSTELLQDTVVDLEGLLADMLAERIARKMESEFINGAGSGSAPNGLVTGSTVGVNLLTGNAVTFGKLKDLEHSVDIAYRRNGAFLMHDLTWAAIEKIVDSSGRPIFLPGYQGLGQQTQRSIFGYPVYISNQFVNYSGSEGDNQPLILFGDFSRYMVRDVAAGFELTRFNELYMGNGQIGFQLWRRSWGDYIGPAGCVKSLNSFDS